MSITLRIFVYHTSHGFAVFTIQTWFTGCRPNICHTVFAIQTNMTFGSIYAIFTVDAFDGHTLFAVSPFDGNTVFSVNTYTGITIYSFDTDMAVFAIFTIDRNIITKTDFQCPVFYRRRNTICTFDLYGIIQVFSYCTAFVVCQTKGFVADIASNRFLNFFQLSHIDGICIFTACSNVCNLSRKILIGIPYRNSTSCSSPNRLFCIFNCIRCKGSTNTFFYYAVCYRIRTDGYTAIYTNNRSITDGYDIICFNRIFIP